jgi:nucleoside-diphosphate-sugar epimerase
MGAILITGGAGFIGSNLAEYLLQMKKQVIVIDIKNNPQNLEKFIEKVEYFSLDIKNYKSVEKIFSLYDDIEGIIHLAAVSRVIWGEENPELCISTNIGGIENILNAIANMKTKPWLIFGSSREVYGEPNKFPVKENFPKNPINIYARTKLIGESMVRNYSKKYKIKSAILRFSNVYGNDRDILDRVIPRFVISALKNEPLYVHGGAQVFDFTNINDTVRGIIKTIEYLENQENNMIYEDFHILTGKPTNILELANIILSRVSSSSQVIITKPRNYDVVKFYGDPSKAYNKLGFSSNIGIEEGISMTIKNLKELVK